MPADKPTAEPSREARNLLTRAIKVWEESVSSGGPAFVDFARALDLDGLLRDRRRLDWLEKIGAYPVYGYGDAAGNPLSVRAAIDAAMEAEDE